MPRFIILFLLLSVSGISYSQYNFSGLPEDTYCSHVKSAGLEQSSYYVPRSENPLLDKYDVTFYFLDLTVEANTVALGGSVTTKAQALLSAIDTIAFELINEMTVDSVFVNGVQRAFVHESDLIIIPLPTPIPFSAYFTSKIFYHGTPPTGGFFSGVTTAYSSTFGKNVTWTLSEPYAAKEWWPTKQDLTDDADSVWVFLTTSQENKAGSEGLLSAVSPMPGGKARYEWKTYYPIDYYLISFAVSDYQDYSIYAHPEGTEDSVLIQNYIYDHPNCLPTYQVGIDRTAGFIELYSDLFGMYPFINEKYGHCLTQLGGGMEHQTMTTIGGFSFGLVAHELGHMWFGDNITCATWSDIWINEGFATYTDYLATSYLLTPYEDSVWLKSKHDHVKSAPGGSVYVPPEDLDNINRIFSGRLSYSKGALLLHMIRFELQDDDMFFNVLQTYVEEYADSVATGDDFREWLELISGKDFTDFFDQWYYGEGYPIYDVVWNQNNGNLNITSTQTTSTTVTPLFKMTVPYYVMFSDGTDTTFLLYQGQNLETYSLTVSKEIDNIEVDPDQWILHQLNSLAVDIEERENPLFFTLGPNPAREQFRLFLSNQPGPETYVILYDLTGRIVMKETVSDRTNLIKTGHLVPGVYQVTVADGNGVMNKKLVVE
jgi:aminopeptidase N